MTQLGDKKQMIDEICQHFDKSIRNLNCRNVESNVSRLRDRLGSMGDWKVQRILDGIRKQKADQSQNL